MKAWNSSNVVLDMPPTTLRHRPSGPGLGLLLATVLLLATSAQAGESPFQLLLQHTGLPSSLHLPVGRALTPERAQALWRGLLQTPATLGTFAPRTTLAWLLREPLASGQALSNSELNTRTARFLHLVVVRPDGYASTALTGRPLAQLGRPTLFRGELYAQGLRVGAFHFDEAGVFYAVDEALRKQGLPVGELPLGRDPATAALLGAEDALVEVVKGLAALLTEPVRTVEGLAQLPSAVAGLIASSPEYFARYGAMNLEDQVREAARLATHVLTLHGGAAAAGPRLATAARGPVLGVSIQGTLVVRELALPVGAVTVSVGAGAVGASVVLMAQGTPPAQGPGQWVPENTSMSAEARRYQSQISGAPEGWAYSIRIGPGPKDKVDFDGFKDGVLLEAKGPGYHELLERMYGKPFFEGIDELLKQASRQRKMSHDLPIHWHFAEREVADLTRKLFNERGYTDIQVFYTPVQP
jgi:hypothetical protein